MLARKQSVRESAFHDFGLNESSESNEVTWINKKPVRFLFRYYRNMGNRYGFFFRTLGHALCGGLQETCFY